MLMAHMMGRSTASIDGWSGCLKTGGVAASRRVEWLPQDGWSGCLKTGGVAASRQVEWLPQDGWSGCLKTGGVAVDAHETITTETAKLLSRG